MTKVDDKEVYSSVRRFFSSLIRQVFLEHFGYDCPRCLYSVRNLAFLPHLMRIPQQWKLISVDQMFEFLEIPANDQEWVLCNYSQGSLRFSRMCAG